MIGHQPRFFKSRVNTTGDDEMVILWGHEKDGRLCGACVVEDRPGIVQKEGVDSFPHHSFLKLINPLQGIEGSNSHVNTNS